MPRKPPLGLNWTASCHLGSGLADVGTVNRHPTATRIGVQCWPLHSVSFLASKHVAVEHGEAVEGSEAGVSS